MRSRITLTEPEWLGVLGYYGGIKSGCTLVSQDYEQYDSEKGSMTYRVVVEKEGKFFAGECTRWPASSITFNDLSLTEVFEKQRTITEYV